MAVIIDGKTIAKKTRENLKKEVEEYTVESFKETSVMLTTQNGSIEVQKYKLPLELEVGDILIQNEFGIYEKK